MTPVAGSKRLQPASAISLHILKLETHNKPPPFPPIHSALPSPSISRARAVRFEGLAVHAPELLELSPVSSSYRNALTSPVNKEVYSTGSEGWKARSNGWIAISLAGYHSPRI